MERLTKRIDENHACFAICEKECPDGIYADNPACMCTAGRAALKKLLEYEDAEEKGKLLILPCKPGDTVYVIYKNHVIECEVYDININYKYIWFTFLHEGEILKTKNIYFLEDFGKTVFLTEQEAKEALGDKKND